VLHNHPSPTRSRLCIGLAGTSILVSCVSVLLVGRLGSAGRTYSEARPLVDSVRSARTLDTSAQLYSLWQESGLRGRHLVHVSRFFHFVPIDEDEPVSESSRFPVQTYDLLGSWEPRLDPRNLLWLAVQSGVVRRVSHVLPPAELDQRLSELTPDGILVSRRGREIRTHENGSPRVIGDRFPELDEPVLLVIDASYFSAGTVEFLLDRLTTSALTTDLLVFSRSEDNPDVGEPDRQALGTLILALREIAE